MSTDVTTAVGTFVWREHVSSDSQRAQDFYTQLFGWEIEPFKSGDFEYPMISANGQMHGGFPSVPAGVPPHWVSDVQVESVDDTVEKVKSAGGDVVSGPSDIPEVGRYAALKDPQGALFVAFQPDGDGPQGEGVFVWDELGTQDVAGSESFYGDVFDWTTSDMGAEYGGYKIFNVGEKGVGGLMKMPDPSVPSMWAPYVATEDVDAIVAKAQELGGATIVEAMDIPAVGRVAVLRDPVGAVFGIIKPEPQS
jgi:predicted enzyme related to lactoylglutathione lyase